MLYKYIYGQRIARKLDFDICTSENKSRNPKNHKRSETKNNCFEFLILLLKQQIHKERKPKITD